MSLKLVDVVQGIVTDLDIGITKEMVVKQWEERCQKLGLVVSSEVQRSETPKGAASQSKTPEPKSVDSETAVLVKFINEMTQAQLVEELFKLTEKFTYQSVGMTMGLPKAGSFSTLRAWCTGEFSPREDSLKAIRKLLVNVASKDETTLQSLRPAGKRPKGGIVGTARVKK